MISVTINLTGLDMWQDALKAFPEKAPQVLDDALLQAANTVATITQNMPPVNSLESGWDALGIPVSPKYGGTMRQSIHGRKTGPLQAEVVADTDYSSFVHDGTSKMPARQFFDWALTYYGGLQSIDETVRQALEGLFG